MNKVKFKLEEGVTAPIYATTGSNGLDVEAFIDEPISLYPGQSQIIPTGIAVELPVGLSLLVLPRSGKALSGLQVGNAPGLVDSDYRHNIGVIAYNASNEHIVIEPKDRIAQFVFIEAIRPELYLVNQLSTTERKGGFGSTDDIREADSLLSKTEVTLAGTKLYVTIDVHGKPVISDVASEDVPDFNAIAISDITGNDILFLDEQGNVWERGKVDLLKGG